MNKIQAKKILGSYLSCTSKMPCYSYNLSALDCIKGSKLVNVKGSVCYGCYALNGNYKRYNLPLKLQPKTKNIIKNDWCKALAYLINNQGNKKDKHYFKFIRDNVQKSVSGEIKRGFVPNDFKVILSDPKNRKSLLDYAKKNTPDIYSKFKKILSNPFSTQRFALYSKLPAAAIPAGLIMSLADTAKKKGIGFDQEFEQTADLTGGQIVPKGLSTEGKVAAGTTGAALGLTKPVQSLMSRVLTPLTVPLISLDLYDRAQAMKDTAKNITAMRPGMQQDKAVEDFAAGDYRGYAMAGGGIAKIAGVDSGPPPERGPNPQGLPGLLKRVKNI